MSHSDTTHNSLPIHTIINAHYTAMQKFFSSWTEKTLHDTPTEEKEKKFPPPLLRSLTSGDIIGVSPNPNYGKRPPKRNSYLEGLPDGSIFEGKIWYKKRGSNHSILSQYLSNSCLELDNINPDSKFYKSKRKKSYAKRKSIVSDDTDASYRLMAAESRGSINTIYNQHVARISAAISSQHIIIYQVSKAIKECRTYPELVGTKGHIEAEKILLLANIRKSILNLKVLNDASQDNLNVYNTITHKIKELSFTENIGKLSSGTRRTIFYLCLIICEEEVISSDVISSECGKIIFDSPVVLEYIPVGYDISLQIYCLDVKIPHSSKMIKVFSNFYHFIYKNATNCFGISTDYNVQKCYTSAFKLLGTCSLCGTASSMSKQLQLINPDESTICKDFRVTIERLYNYSTL